jgi:hypothetical protein
MPVGAKRGHNLGLCETGCGIHSSCPPSRRRDDDAVPLWVPWRPSRRGPTPLRYGPGGGSERCGRGAPYETRARDSPRLLNIRYGQARHIRPVAANLRQWELSSHAKTSAFALNQPLPYLVGELPWAEA